MLASVVIPAHNEESVISRCLSAITTGSQPGEVEITIVCNGCTDATARTARAHSPAVIVIETASASKIQALNLGDSRARAFPRFYIDADSIVPLESIRRVSETLASDRVYAAAPRKRVDLDGRSCLVKSYYRVWLELPYAKRSALGSGVYALSETGRKRFTEFPETFAEDDFVSMLFDTHEKICVETAWFLMATPRTIRALVAIEARKRIGAMQLRELFPGRSRLARIEQRKELLRFAMSVRWWPALAAYLLVKVAARLLYYRDRALNRPFVWTRDETSRGTE